ncbi:EpsG family protein [Flagellimonas sp. 389]|uniref:EpsG family protein n=1 Tax=Flagellimonas sp. 389 TaxID=2835862 RepID=UPI001BD4C216|nr:EpsG family protein [Flagellimonas sp. 389]MBS9461268.1 EpsG family protein [Flagellimonas sp. 389]
MSEVKSLGIKVKIISLFNCFLFLISPLLALPSIFVGIYNRNRVSLILLLILASLITYQLVPSETKDLYQFYRFYKDVKYIGFEEFLLKLTIQKKTDFVFYYGIYFFAKLGISGQVFFSLCTFATLYLIYLVYNKLVEKREISNKYYLLGIVSIFISIEFLGLYSGIRNLLAISIAIYGFYIGIFDNKKGKGFLLLLFSSLIHFGTLLFFPIYFLGIFKKIKSKSIFILYITSFAFFLFTKKYLYHIAIALPFPESFDYKIKAYLEGMDIIEKGNMESTAALISYKIRVSWIYFAHTYLLLSYKRESNYRNLVILLMGLLNIFSVTPDIQLRLTYLVEIMFIYLLFYEYNYRENKLLIKLFFIFLVPSFIVNLFIYKDYFIESLFNKNFITLAGILLKKVELIFFW